MFVYVCVVLDIIFNIIFRYFIEVLSPIPLETSFPPILKCLSV